MPVIERDVVLQGVDENGNHTVDLPITNLKNIVDEAEIKEIPVSGDMIPIIDSEDQGQMKKVPLEAMQQAGGSKGQPAGRVSGADLQGRLRDRHPDGGNGDGQADHDQRRDLGVLCPQSGQGHSGWRVLYRVRVRNGGRMKKGTSLPA